MEAITEATDRLRWLLAETTDPDEREDIALAIMAAWCLCPKRDPEAGISTRAEAA